MPHALAYQGLQPGYIIMYTYDACKGLHQSSRSCSCEPHQLVVCLQWHQPLRSCVHVESRALPSLRGGTDPYRSMRS